MFENDVLNKIIEPKRAQLNAGIGKLHNAQLVTKHY
jgi:hypothetical protein